MAAESGDRADDGQGHTHNPADKGTRAVRLFPNLLRPFPSTAAHGVCRSLGRVALVALPPIDRVPMGGKERLRTGAIARSGRASLFHRTTDEGTSAFRVHRSRLRLVPNSTP